MRSWAGWWWEQDLFKRPPDSGYRGVGYDFITVETKEERGGEPEISYTLDTKRARSEVRGQRTQSALLRDLVATASSDQNRDQQIGHTLFNLLIPPSSKHTWQQR
jgi:hypothetical protein